MPLTKVDDIVFSFAHAEIKAIGTVIETCTSAQKPSEFGDKGENWDQDGWLVKVKWKVIKKPFRPKDHIDVIRPLLSDKHSPIQKNGNGNQGCYLAKITPELATVLYQLSGKNDNVDASEKEAKDTEKAEREVLINIEQDTTLHQTEKEQLILARRGQGKYRKNLEAIEIKCRVTGITDKNFLIASHSKPWRDSTNSEKVDGYNGFLFSPHIDRLYDQGWISFSDNGDLILADESVKTVLEHWKIHCPLNIGKLTEQQKKYLKYHRDNVHKSRIEKIKNSS